MRSILSTFFAQLVRAQIPKAQKDTEDLSEFVHFWDLHSRKLLIKMLLLLTYGVDNFLTWVPPNCSKPRNSFVNKKKF